MAKLKLRTKGLSDDEKKILGDAVKKAMRRINHKRRCDGGPHLQHYIELK